MKIKLIYKVSLNVLLVIFVITFHSDLTSLLEDKLILFATPLVVSICYPFIQMGTTPRFSLKLFLGFLLFFTTFYLILNLNWPTFNLPYFLISVLLSVPYVVFMECIFPSIPQEAA